MLLLIILLISTSCATFKKKMEKSLGPVLSGIRNTSYNSYLKRKYSYLDKAENKGKPLSDAKKKKQKLKAALNHSVVGQFIKPPSVQGHIDYSHDKRFNRAEQDALNGEQEKYERRSRLKFKEKYEVQKEFSGF